MKSQKWSTRLFLIVLVIMMTAVSCVACKDGKTAEFPEYEEQTRRLGVFSSPAPTQAAYAECAEAGFNHVLIDQNYGWMGSEVYFDILEYCQNAGMKAICMNLVPDDFVPNAERDAALNSVACYAGKNFVDEPSYDRFEEIAGYIRDFEANNPGKLFLNNLFPFHSENLGVDTFEEYVQGYIDIVLSKVTGKKILMCDIYPLLYSGRGNYIRNGYLYNLETIANLTKGTDIEVDYYYQTHGHANCRDIASVADVRFQYNCLMAYGVKGFWAFTYPNQGGVDFLDGHGLVKNELVNGVWETTKNDTYFYVQQANQEVLAMDDAYLHFDYQGTAALIGTANEGGYNENFELLNTPLQKIDGIKKAEATRDTLIGVFEKDGVNAYMVTNFTEPSSSLGDTVELTFANGLTKVQIWLNGVMTEKPILEHKIRLQLKGGEGAFIVAR